MQTITDRDTIKEEMQADAQEILNNLPPCGCPKPNHVLKHLQTIGYLIIVGLILAIGVAHQMTVASLESMIL